MLLGLRTVVYKVADLAEAKRWYSELFDIEPYFDEPFYVGFNVGGYELGLDPDISDVISGNNVGAYWAVDNARDAMERLKAKGAEAHSEARDVGGGIVVASVLDPFGNVVGIIENPHFTLGGE